MVEEQKSERRYLIKESDIEVLQTRAKITHVEANNPNIFEEFKRQMLLDLAQHLMKGVEFEMRRMHEGIELTVKIHTLKRYVPMKHVFVFGSNSGGKHGKGAAYAALMHYGALYGQGEGLQGNSYAIPTKDADLKTRSLADIQLSVNRFLHFAEDHFDNYTFYVTPIGCGLAGYKYSQIAPFFRDAPSNVILPAEFGGFAWTMPKPL